MFTEFVLSLKSRASTVSTIVARASPDQELISQFRQLKEKVMKARSSLFAVAILSTVILCLCGRATSQSAGGATAPSQNNATIENQIIAYDALRQIAGEIAGRVKKNCNCSTVLLPDSNSQSEIIAAKAFDVSVLALVQAYDAIGVQPSIETESFAAPSLSDFASLLSAIKSSATYSNQNFQPTTQAMITLLSSSLQDKNIEGRAVALRTANLPGNLDDGVKDVQEQLGKIKDAQKRAKQRVQNEPKEKDKDGKDKESPDAAALTDLDKELGAFRTALGGTGPDGTALATIIKGKTLLKASPFSLLTVSVDMAGGDTKVTHFFWRELIMPTSNPSYNGGAGVSFLLTDQNSNFQDGSMFRLMYGWSKWKSPKFVLK